MPKNKSQPNISILEIVRKKANSLIPLIRYEKKIVVSTKSTYNCIRRRRRKKKKKKKNP